MAIQNIVKLITRLWSDSRPRRVALGLSALAALAGATSCGITEMNITLGEQMYTYDLMNSFPLPIPRITCPAPPKDCQTVFRQMTGIIDNRVQATCDTGTNQCVADLALTIIYIVNVAQDPAFTTGFAQGNADNVRDVTINYTITNNANFNIDKIDVYIGPNGIMSKTDAGVQQMGSLGPIIAGGLLTQNQQPMVIADDTPAHDQVVDNILHPENPFNFLMQSTVRFKGGDPLPTGQIVVSLTPVVKLLRR